MFSLTVNSFTFRPTFVVCKFLFALVITRNINETLMHTIIAIATMPVHLNTTMKLVRETCANILAWIHELSWNGKQKNTIIPSIMLAPLFLCCVRKCEFGIKRYLIGITNKIKNEILGSGINISCS